MFCEIDRNGRKKKDSLLLVLTSCSAEDAVPALHATATPIHRVDGTGKEPH
jgi:hypothetical protein